MPQLQLALDGMIDRLTNRDPFGPPPLALPDKGDVARGLAAFLRDRKKPPATRRRR